MIKSVLLFLLVVPFTASAMEFQPMQISMVKQNYRWWSTLNQGILKTWLMPMNEEVVDYLATLDKRDIFDCKVKSIRMPFDNALLSRESVPTLPGHTVSVDAIYSIKNCVRTSSN